MSFFRNARPLLAAKALRKFTPGPPRHLNEARFPTVDRKACSLVWKNRNQVDITLQDRASSMTFPLSLRRDAASFISCFHEGGIISLNSKKEPAKELRVGSDNGLLYFSMKEGDAVITTGLGQAEAALASTLIQHADRKRIATSL